MNPEIIYNLGRVKQLPGTAIYSEDKKYRYVLTREWNSGRNKTLITIMMNPSTATENILDPTVRKVTEFAIMWGFDRCIVLNLFAYRSTDIKQIFKVQDPVGPENDYWIIETIENNKDATYLAAWGTKGNYLDRDYKVRTIADNLGVSFNYLKLSNEGHPIHPLYLSKTSLPIPWRNNDTHIE